MNVSIYANSVFENLGFVLYARVGGRGGEDAEKLLKLGVDLCSTFARVGVVGVLEVGIGVNERV